MQAPSPHPPLQEKWGSGYPDGLTRNPQGIGLNGTAKKTKIVAVFDSGCRAPVRRPSGDALPHFSVTAAGDAPSGLGLGLTPNSGN